MNLGERLKKARLEANMTQRQLATASGVKQQMISKLEVGRASETSDIVPLAKALGVRSEWLDSGEEPMRLGEESSKKNFAVRLDKALTYAGIPQGRNRIASVSKMFGVSREAVRKWLAGESIPDTKRIAGIAQRTGVRGEWLLTSQGPMCYGDKEEMDEQSLPPYAMQLAHLIAQAPPEKVQAILTLLGIRENDTHQQPHKETPSTQPTPKNKERRSGKDRRQNVHEVDFERRSGRDRRAGAFVMIDREGKLKSPKKDKTEKKEKGDRDE